MRDRLIFYSSQNTLSQCNDLVITQGRSARLESGALKGNQNAFKHGRYTKREIEERLELRKLIREANKYLEEFET